MKSNRSRGQKGRRDRNGNQALMTIPRPLAIPNIAIEHVVKIRYACTAQTSLAISYRNLLDSILVATTATAGAQLFDLVKIRKIEAWSYVPTGVSTLTIQFVGRTDGLIGDDKSHTDTSMGIEPAYLSVKPSARSQASMFQQSNTAVAFNIYCAQATIVDLSLTFRTAMEGVSATSAQQALVGAAAGLVYYRGFDGIATATTKFTPQGTPQII
jgi:hypothetical protein